MSLAFRIIIIGFLLHWPSISATEDCNLSCSTVFDPVCGLVLSENGVYLVKYQNLCTLRLTRCKSPNIKEIKHVPNKICSLKKHKTMMRNGRRGADFSIVGAHQACNHSCPTYCVDTYDPVCGVIRQTRGGDARPTFITQTFVNHCHVDLYSCTTGLNITISAMNGCYENTSLMLFMSQVAGLKSLGLLEDDGLNEDNKKKPI
ncbi:hypothetical protein O0L34_g3249 [Tuta absoluta]|nr:hypothetical protein O0L34_g3249 [Tuta absoluta]